ncbi:hypothetical protein [Dyella telluris]|uniref:Uncharacterized protein n=1 Tax=Dyella telluris TaxID=2763498 RepID=A0A7G8Q4L6_9GAMM|nr:hypothetical protein [Dyella telluris]QNK01724.1 hypothetical protein H8F01_00645 [Dyella telluris]
MATVQITRVHKGVHTVGLPKMPEQDKITLQFLLGDYGHLIKHNETVDADEFAQRIAVRYSKRRSRVLQDLLNKQVSA